MLAAGADQAEQAEMVVLGRALLLMLGVVELRDKAMTVVLVLIAAQIMALAAQVVQEVGRVGGVATEPAAQATHSWMPPVESGSTTGIPYSLKVAQSVQEAGLPAMTPAPLMPALHTQGVAGLLS